LDRQNRLRGRGWPSCLLILEKSELLTRRKTMLNPLLNAIHNRSFFTGILLSVPLVLGMIVFAPGAGGWSPDGGTLPEPGGVWLETGASQAAGSICDAHGTTGQVCLEWCEFGPGGEVIPSGLFCCKASSQNGSENPACSNPV
jgi:hypothetical protein